MYRVPVIFAKWIKMICCTYCEVVVTLGTVGSHLGREWLWGLSSSGWPEGVSERDCHGNHSLKVDRKVLRVRKGVEERQQTELSPPDWIRLAVASSCRGFPSEMHWVWTWSPNRHFLLKLLSCLSWGLLSQRQGWNSTLTESNTV